MTASLAEQHERLKGLYLVSGPIGNLGDISQRALQILGGVDEIICEDQRVSLKLLRHYGIQKPLITYHDHNGEKMRPLILSKLREGKALALLSDAGSPLIADPGYKLVQEVLQASLDITSIPGANAALTALQLSGLPCHRFLFGGFLPPRSAARQKELARYRALDSTLIFYETAPRLLAMLEDTKLILGNRQAAVARELTKWHEQVLRLELSELIGHYQKLDTLPKGEICVVIGPPMKGMLDIPDALALGGDSDLPNWQQALEPLIDKLGLKKAAKQIASEYQQEARRVYQYGLSLTHEKIQ